MQFFKKGNHWLTDVVRCGGILLIPISVIASVLISPPNVEFSRQYYEFGLERIIFLVVIFTLLLHLGGFWGKALSITFTLLLFFLSLIFKWQTADYLFLLGGLLPLRDANAYYQGAQSIIYGFDLVGTASYRPIFIAFLSVIMKVLNSNLQESLIVLVALNALGVYFAANEVRQSLKNNLAAAIYIVLGYMFFRRFSGTTLTENIGFCLGNMALIFLIRGSVKGKLNFILYGLFLLTTGLNARAGAFLILPALLIWAGFSFRSTHGLWRPLTLGILTVSLGMVTNFVLVKLLNSPTAEPFSNYSYTLYGLAAGNKGWEQAGVDYPNASTDEIYYLTFQKIKEDPMLFAQGIVGAYADYFKASNGAFSFLLLKSERRELMNLILWSLSFIGLLVALTKRQQKAYSIIFAFLVGILFSVGLVPPADSTMMRAYAATIPMSLYVIAMGTVLPSKPLRQSNGNSTGTDWSGLQVPLLLSMVLLATSLVLPSLIKLTGQPPVSTSSISCDSGQKAVTFSIADGSSITLKHGKGSTYIPDIEFFRLAGTIHEQLLKEEEKSLIMGLPDGATITIIRSQIDIENPVLQTNGFLITKGIPRQGIQTICIDATKLGTFYFAGPGSYEISTQKTSLTQQSAIVIQTLQKTGLWLAFILIMVWFFEVYKFPSRKMILVAFNTAVIAGGILLFLHGSGLVPLAWEKKTLESNQFRHRNNFLYAFDMGNDSISDTIFLDFPAYLYEDDILMAQPHEVLSIIAKYGRGSYLLQNQFLFFSTSDNSNPEVNGRQYTLEYPSKIRLRYQVSVFAAALLALLLHMFYFKPSLKQNNL